MSVTVLQNSAGDSGAIEGSTETVTDRWVTVQVVLGRHYIIFKSNEAYSAATFRCFTL